MSVELIEIDSRLLAPLYYNVFRVPQKPLEYGHLLRPFKKWRSLWSFLAAEDASPRVMCVLVRPKSNPLKVTRIHLRHRVGDHYPVDLTYKDTWDHLSLTRGIWCTSADNDVEVVVAIDWSSCSRRFLEFCKGHREWNSRTFLAYCKGHRE